MIFYVQLLKKVIENENWFRVIQIFNSSCVLFWVFVHTQIPKISLEVQKPALHKQRSLFLPDGYMKLEMFIQVQLQLLIARHYS